MTTVSRAIAVTSGKGGVGKTNVSINLSLALAKLGKQVALFDADMGLANAHILMGMKAERTIEDFLVGRHTLKEIMLDCPGQAGAKLISGGSGLSGVLSLEDSQRNAIIQGFGDLDGQVDYLVIDTAAGLENNVVPFLKASDRVLIVLVGEPTSFMDAYAVIKMMHNEVGATDFEVLTNMVTSPIEGQQLFKKFHDVCIKMLDVNLYHVGSLPRDPEVVAAVRARKPVVLHSPLAPITKAYDQLAMKIAKDPKWLEHTNGLSFFINKFVESTEQEAAR